jgi:hypothetical protein
MEKYIGGYPPYGDEAASAADRKWFQENRKKKYRLRPNFSMEIGCPAKTRWIMVPKISSILRIRTGVPVGIGESLHTHYDESVPDRPLRNLFRMKQEGQGFILLEDLLPEGVAQ